MTLAAHNSPPPGWYPDPSGERQWRVWTGTIWSELTRPYGESVSAPKVVESLPLVNALHLLVRYGVVSVFAGLGLLVSSLAHWPGTHQPAPLWFTETASDLGIALMLFGTVIFAFTLRELQGRWSLAAFVPGVNVLAVSATVTQRLSGRSPLTRVVAEVVLIALFVAGAHAEPWLSVALALVAIGQVQWPSALLDQLWPPTEGVTPAP